MTFTATLSNPGETDVTIVTNLGEIVIAAGETTGTLFGQKRRTRMFMLILRASRRR